MIAIRGTPFLMREIFSAAALGLNGEEEESAAFACGRAWLRLCV